jgi:RNA polymerase sigma-70 factor (ECF subfamily)
MRKNGLARLGANAVARGMRAWVGRWYRPRPVVPTTAFQDRTEPFPGHWREFPKEWSRPVTRERLDRALLTLPEPWREVLLRHDTAGAGRRDDPTSETTDLTVAQHRDILARARAALRDALDADQRR